MTSRQYNNDDDDNKLIYDFNIILEFHLSCNVFCFLCLLRFFFAHYDLFWSAQVPY